MLKKVYLGLVLAFFGLLLSFSFLAYKVSAQVPGLLTPCTKDGNEDPNFGTLRPYQASPCADAPVAEFCSNMLVFQETFDFAGTNDCQEHGESGDFTCHPDFQVEPHNLNVELTGSMFPIMGNTELVKNSQSSEDQIDDATKVNEYASWYLSGVNSKAEYGATKNDDNTVVNFSGPVQKLLPSVIQDAQRINVIKSLDSGEQTYKDVADPSGGEITDEAENHNQIVVCSKQGGGGIIGTVEDFLNIGKSNPIECYKGDGSKAQGDVKRLADWESGGLSIVRTGLSGVINTLSNTPVLKDTLPGIMASYIDKPWNNRLPPLPWDVDENGEPLFKTELDYQKAYNEWRGKSCFIIPFLNKLICAELGVARNEWSDLFQYVPLANTSDKKGVNYLLTDDGPNIVAGQSTEIINNFSESYTNAPLYFAHTQEVYDLSNLLNTTYTPKDVESEPLPETTEKIKTYFETGGTDAGYAGQKCSAANVRVNRGDDLFPGDGPELTVTGVQYFITETECHETFIPAPENCDPLVDKGCSDIDILHCPALVSIELQLGTKTPYAEEIFSSTVADSGSTFRKMYPKVQGGAPISCIANIPTITDVEYDPSKSEPPNGGDQTFGVKNIPLDSVAGSTQLTFPHIGSVYEYFLKGIQTALRPKGYGQPIENGKYCKPVVPKDCSGVDRRLTIPAKYSGEFKANFIDLASRWTVDCPGADYNLADECYDFVVDKAVKEGVNPAFALTIWLNESGASNYCHGGLTTQDFGINLPALYQNITGQIDVFMNMAKLKLCDGTPGFTEPIHGWLSRFQSSSGTCDPTDERAYKYYYEVKDETWSYLTSFCAKDGKFGITWPTDNSCP